MHRGRPSTAREQSKGAHFYNVLCVFELNRIKSALAMRVISKSKTPEMLVHPLLHHFILRTGLFLVQPLRCRIASQLPRNTLPRRFRPYLLRCPSK